MANKEKTADEVRREADLYVAIAEAYLSDVQKAAKAIKVHVKKAKRARKAAYKVNDDNLRLMKSCTSSAGVEARMAESEANRASNPINVKSDLVNWRHINNWKSENNQ